MLPEDMISTTLCLSKSRLAPPNWITAWQGNSTQLVWLSHGVQKSNQHQALGGTGRSVEEHRLAWKSPISVPAGLASDEAR